MFRLRSTMFQPTLFPQAQSRQGNSVPTNAADYHSSSQKQKLTQECTVGSFVNRSRSRRVGRTPTMSSIPSHQSEAVRTRRNRAVDSATPVQLLGQGIAPYGSRTRVHTSLRCVCILVLLLGSFVQVTHGSAQPVDDEKDVAGANPLLGVLVPSVLVPGANIAEPALLDEELFDHVRYAIALEKSRGLIDNFDPRGKSAEHSGHPINQLQAVKDLLEFGHGLVHVFDILRAPKETHGCLRTGKLSKTAYTTLMTKINGLLEAICKEVQSKVADPQYATIQDYWINSHGAFAAFMDGNSVRNVEDVLGPEQSLSYARFAVLMSFSRGICDHFHQHGPSMFKHLRERFVATAQETNLSTIGRNLSHEICRKTPSAGCESGGTYHTAQIPQDIYDYWMLSIRSDVEDTRQLFRDAMRTCDLCHEPGKPRWTPVEAAQSGGKFMYDGKICTCCRGTGKLPAVDYFDEKLHSMENLPKSLQTFKKYEDAEEFRNIHSEFMWTVAAGRAEKEEKIVTADVQRKRTNADELAQIAAEANKRALMRDLQSLAETRGQARLCATFEKVDVLKVDEKNGRVTINLLTGTRTVDLSKVELIPASPTVVVNDELFSVGSPSCTTVMTSVTSTGHRSPLPLRAFGSLTSEASQHSRRLDRAMRRDSPERKEDTPAWFRDLTSPRPRRR